MKTCDASDALAKFYGFSDKQSLCRIFTFALTVGPIGRSSPDGGSSRLHCDEAYKMTREWGGQTQATILLCRFLEISPVVFWVSWEGNIPFAAFY